MSARQAILERAELQASDTLLNNGTPIALNYHEIITTYEVEEHHHQPCVWQNLDIHTHR